MNQVSHQESAVTLFYDGECPICQKEVAWLSRLNKQEKLVFQDINAPEFSPEPYHKTHSEFMAEIHGMGPDRKLIKGMPVFRLVYKAVGLGWLLTPTGWPLLKPLFDRLYILFAQNRIKLGSLLFKTQRNCQRCTIPKNKGD